MRLHHFHSSSTSFRVRIALGLKGLAYESVPVHLRFADGDHDRPDYRARNPQGNVPLFEDGELSIVQSIAIMEYLDRAHPEPPLLPADEPGRARVRSLSLWIACEIQPLNNLRVERYLNNVMGASPEQQRAWRRHWIQVGFDALETLLARDPRTGRFCHGDTPTMADCCLVPQVRNAIRPAVGHDLATWPTIQRITEAMRALPPVAAAAPENQPDYVEVKQH